MNYNEMRKLAVEKGFKGKNPNAEQLKAFLDACTAAELAEVKPAEVQKVKRVVAFGDGLKGRRSAVQAVVQEVMAEAEKPLHWGGIVKGWETKTGVKHDHISWHDVGHAIRNLCKTGEIMEVKLDTDRKPLYQKVVQVAIEAAPEPAEATEELTATEQA